MGTFHIEVTFITVTQNARLLVGTYHVYIYVYRLTTAWTVQGSNPGFGEIFCSCLDQYMGSPSLLYNGSGSFPGVKWPGLALTAHAHVVPMLKKD